MRGLASASLKRLLASAFVLRRSSLCGHVSGVPVHLLVAGAGRLIDKQNMVIGDICHMSQPGSIVLHHSSCSCNIFDNPTWQSIVTGGFRAEVNESVGSSHERSEWIAIGIASAANGISAAVCWHPSSDLGSP